MNKSISSARPMQALHNPPRYPCVAFSRDDAVSAGTASTASMRVLIVEDDFLVATDIESALTDAGIAVAGVASSAEEALALAEAERPALAVMDIRLAGKRDGIDAALDLLRGLGIRCIFATAHHDEGTRARAQPAQPLAWVPKPYAMASLVDAVQRALLAMSSNKK